MKKSILSILAIASLVFTSCDDEKNDDITTPVVTSSKTTLPGNIIESTTLDASKEYVLTGSTIVNSGATLTIPAGTKIEALAGGSAVYIAALKGGKINIEGTAANPVVMSSKDPKPGDWGGLTLCGSAVTSAGAEADGDVLKKNEALAEVGGFIYGGTNNADSSGSINYLVIRGAGANINPDSQYNGISFYAVGSGTKVSNIAVIDGDDDGVEFFGGTVSASNLYLENNSDDSVDWTEEWSGKISNVYISHTKEGFSTVFEGDKDNANPQFENITAVSTVGGTGLQFKKQSGGTITGLNLSGYGVDIDMKDAGPLSNVKIEGKDADASLLEGETRKYKLNSGKDAAKVDISAWTWRNAGL